MQPFLTSEPDISATLNSLHLRGCWLLYLTSCIEKCLSSQGEKFECTTSVFPEDGSATTENSRAIVLLRCLFHSLPAQNSYLTSFDFFLNKRSDNYASVTVKSNNSSTPKHVSFPKGSQQTLSEWKRDTWLGSTSFLPHILHATINFHYTCSHWMLNCPPNIHLIYLYLGRHRCCKSCSGK